MRNVDAHTAARFARRPSSLCLCWRLIRTDGVEVGLTDHDSDVSFAGTTYVSIAGADGSALEGTTSLSPDNSEIVGVLRTETLDPAAIAAGRYDNATIEVWRVDWEDPTARLLLRQGVLGNIERAGEGYTAEFRSLKHRLDQVAGRIYARTCDAALGDARCGVDLTDPAFSSEAVVIGGSERSIDVSGLAGFAQQWFAGGTLRVLDGDAAGLIRSVRGFEVSGAVAVLHLWQSLPAALDIGTTLRATAGCDKRRATCQTKFSNIENFRGFPFIPGTDVLTRYPVDGTTDETSL